MVIPAPRPPPPIDLRGSRRREAENFDYLLKARERFPFLTVTDMSVKLRDVEIPGTTQSRYGLYCRVPFRLEDKVVWGFATSEQREAFCADFKSMPIPYNFAPRDIRLWDSFQ